MSSVELAAEVFKNLEPEDFRILHAVETGMSTFKYVPEDKIASLSRLPKKEATYRLERENNFGLIYRRKKNYTGYVLNMTGYDLLAINALVKADVLKALGKPLGKGKESDVYTALDTADKKIAVKLH